MTWFDVWKAERKPWRYSRHRSRDKAEQTAAQASRVDPARFDVRHEGRVVARARKGQLEQVDNDATVT